MRLKEKDEKQKKGRGRLKCKREYASVEGGGKRGMKKKREMKGKKDKREKGVL